MAWADLADCRCYYELVGEGEPLLLIPGLGGTCRLWDPVLPELARHFTLILPDNRDVGRTASKKRRAKTLAHNAADLVELLDVLQLDRSHVMGVSLGGVIAQRMAVDHPSRVDRLILVSCTDRFSPYLWQIASLLGQTLRRFPKEVFVRTMELLGTAPEYLDRNLAFCEERIKERCQIKVPARAIGAQMRALACSEMDEQYYRIAAPTLVIAGEYDAIIPSCYARAMAAKIPDSRFVLIRGAGHNPLADYPERSAPPIMRFLRGRGEETDQQDGGRPAARENAAAAEGTREVHVST
jgi:pimeloyl-ACP methyl ester carboxylesterase